MNESIRRASAKERVMGNTWICHLTDFLDTNGRIAPQAGPARRIAEHYAAIVASVSNVQRQTVKLTEVPCPRLIELDLKPVRREFFLGTP